MSPDLTAPFAQMLTEAARFRDALHNRRADLAAPDFPWYPYDSIGNLVHLSALLAGEHADLLRRPGGRLLDVGAADGELTFYLESLGWTVDAIDNPPTNMNGCRALRLYRDALGSRLRLFETDLDSQFALPDAAYDLVLFLGILYHLKNPYYALETLARRARRMLLSTRIARYNVAEEQVGAPGAVNERRIEIAAAPLAYLVAPQECNNDATNYWIFSEHGLRRILERTGWTIRRLITVGAVDRSDPATENGDERAFVLVESALADSA